MPRDREKNIWPPADARTLIQPVPRNTSKFGLNTKESPSDAPSMVTLRIMIMTIMTNSAGMAMVEKRSMPLATPPMTITTVSATMISVKMEVCTWSVKNDEKYSLLSAPFTPQEAPNRSPRFATAYFRQ